MPGWRIVGRGDRAPSRAGPRPGDRQRIVEEALKGVAAGSGPRCRAGAAHGRRGRQGRRSRRPRAQEAVNPSAPDSLRPLTDDAPRRPAGRLSGRRADRRAGARRRRGGDRPRCAASASTTPAARRRHRRARAAGSASRARSAAVPVETLAPASAGRDGYVMDLSRRRARAAARLHVAGQHVAAGRRLSASAAAGGAYCTVDGDRLATVTGRLVRDVVQVAEQQLERMRRRAAASEGDLGLAAAVMAVRVVHRYRLVQRRQRRPRRSADGGGRSCPSRPRPGRRPCP